MGEFEDPWEDEYDSDGSSVVVNASSDQDDQEMGMIDEYLYSDDAATEEELEEDMQVYLPGQDLQEGEELVVDNSAYDMLHAMGVDWPCLSFDILSDNLGAQRKTVCF